MGDRTVSQIAVERFQSDTDDFDEWVGIFQTAVNLAHNPADEAAKHELYKQWLPIKLDRHGRTVFTECDITKTWPELKEQFKKLLVNPVDKYSWKANRQTLTWDGQESLHTLATKIKAKVDKFDPDGQKDKEYFIRFRLALPPAYR